FLMNSPLVIETARKLVAVAEFQACQDNEARIRYLYERIWQRPPNPEELKLGLDFVADERPAKKLTSSGASLQPVSNDSGENKNFGPGFAARQAFRNAGGSRFRRREPLKIWEEYAHALLQANETSFVN